MASASSLLFPTQVLGNNHENSEVYIPSQCTDIRHYNSPVLSTVKLYCLGVEQNIQTLFQGPQIINDLLLKNGLNIEAVICPSREDDVDRVEFSLLQKPGEIVPEIVENENSSPYFMGGNSNDYDTIRNLSLEQIDGVIYKLYVRAYDHSDMLLEEGVFFITYTGRVN